MRDLLIVGAGAAGIWAAVQASSRGIVPTLLDVGLGPGPETPLNRNLYDLRREDPMQQDYLLGKRFENLHNLHHPYISPKLKSPRFRYVTDRAEELSPLERQGFDAVQSFAAGGLSNAWGGSVYRFGDEDLKAFPFGRRELDPYYDLLTERIGISGSADDLLDDFGPATNLQPTLQLDRSATLLLDHYQAHTSYYHRAGIRIGYPRSAILSRTLGDRAACTYDNLSFWQPQIPYLYTPAMTLRELIADHKIEYMSGHFTERFTEKDDVVTVAARRLEGTRTETIRARKLILAAGALGSARLVLRSRDDTRTRLPLLDNPTGLIPFFHPRLIGRSVEKHSHGLTHLNILYRGPHWDSVVKASVYGYTSPLASDTFSSFPLSARGILACFKYVVPAVMVLQLFFKAGPRPDHYLQLTETGALALHAGRPPEIRRLVHHLIVTLRRAGFLSHHALVHPLPSGNGIHYAGTLPMSTDPSLPHRTDVDGRLLGTRHVHIADGAVFPELSAKNLTLTIMANAMRTADRVIDSLRRDA